MKRILCSLAFAALLASAFARESAADDPFSAVLKREGYAVSLDLKFSKKKQNPLQHVLNFLDYGPDGYATGFVVGDGLVMTAYHVVSGSLSTSKKIQLGFSPDDELDVKTYVNGCPATVLKVDQESDLALLRVCHTDKHSREAVAFPSSLDKDEKLVVIARPNGDKMVRRGVFSGPYMFRGQQYWSAKIEGRDGFSGSPVYNDKAELVGVFSGYDWAQKVAVISPSEKARKLIEDYKATAGKDDADQPKQ
jgi:S1-C subfamily serine protease